VCPNQTFSTQPSANPHNKPFVFEVYLIAMQNAED